MKAVVNQDKSDVHARIGKVCANVVFTWNRPMYTIAVKETIATYSSASPTDRPSTNKHMKRNNLATDTAITTVCIVSTIAIAAFTTFATVVVSTVSSEVSSTCASFFS